MLNRGTRPRAEHGASGRVAQADFSGSTKDLMTLGEQASFQASSEQLEQSSNTLKHRSNRTCCRVLRQQPSYTQLPKHGGPSPGPQTGFDGQSILPAVQPLFMSF